MICKPMAPRAQVARSSSPAPNSNCACRAWAKLRPVALWQSHRNSVIIGFTALDAGGMSAQASTGTHAALSCQQEFLTCMEFGQNLELCEKALQECEGD